MNCFEAAFIKRTVVGNKWQTVYERLNFSPYFRKVFRFFCITVSQSMNSCGPLSIVIGAGTDQSIDFVYNFSIPYNNNSYTTYTGAFIVGCFKVDSGSMNKSEG